jgi:hypothetical protein
VPEIKDFNLSIVATSGNAIALLEYLVYARGITQESKRKDSSP